MHHLEVSIEKKIDFRTYLIFEKISELFLTKISEVFQFFSRIDSARRDLFKNAIKTAKCKVETSVLDF